MSIESYDIDRISYDKYLSLEVFNIEIMIEFYERNSSIVINLIKQN